jgi:hypothetical protein
MGRHRWWLVALIVFVALVVAVRLIADPLVTRQLRRALNHADGIRGRVGAVHVTFFPPGVSLRELKLIALPGGDWDRPLLYVETAHASLLGRSLLRGHLEARAEIDGPKLIVEAPAPHPSTTPAEIPIDRRLGATLHGMVPGRLDRLDVHDGEILIVTRVGHRRPELWIHGIEVTLSDLATRRKLEGDDGARLQLDAVVQKTGAVHVDVALEPLAPRLTFAGKASLRHLHTADLYAFLDAAEHLQAPEGTIDLFVDLRCRAGALTGGVKPLFKDVKVFPADPGNAGWRSRMKATLADATIHFASDKVEGRHAVATIIPIKGTISSPDVQVLPTILGIIRNAFVVALESGFANLPPPSAEKPQGVVTQTVKALKKDEGPPKAQPTKKDEKKDEKKEGSDGKAGSK